MRIRNKEDDMSNNSRESFEDDLSKFETMTPLERESLLRRIGRDVFDEQFNRSTTQRAIGKIAHESLSNSDIEEIITRSAKTASKETLEEYFRTLDINPDDREDSRNFRDDIKFIRNVRKIVGDSGKNAIKVILLALMLAGIYGMWRNFLNGPPLSIGSITTHVQTPAQTTAPAPTPAPAPSTTPSTP